jgi:hypothetical protein
MRRRSQLAGLATLIAAATIACSDTGPAGPTRSLAIADRDAIRLHVAIDDVRARVIPTLGDSLYILDLSQALSALTRAIDARDADAFRLAITQADGALGGLASRGVREPVADADLDVVRLALDNARSMIASR